MDSVTRNRVRALTLEDLGVKPASSRGQTVGEAEITALPENDEVLIEVRAALKMGFAGVIFSGPPGTGKSWYAKRAALAISGDVDAIRIVQFHTSYQYEDFMEGFSPQEGGGFQLQKKTFLLLCDDALEQPETTYVLLIDEISRCDVARVFGEGLTYIESDKRGHSFTLSSGNSMIIPPNIVILATMNPWDKGVDELDVALERRFARIEMPPSSVELKRILLLKQAEPEISAKIVGFFEFVQSLDDEMLHLGHAYFLGCTDELSAQRAWKFSLLPFFKKTCRLDRVTLNRIVKHWDGLFTQASLAAEPTPGAPDQAPAAAEAT
ncbi:AAA family ATPase [Kaistia defluvii]|uniref:McrB family protein n=1 Tax=Kaistia defluvii TaxID=410841 RepID=UPI002252EB2C|nr:AAA family ATPase [Kaistia defluvii]MCX5518423.1 AAA family ATPase [Kaistia defluvii]